MAPTVDAGSMPLVSRERAAEWVDLYGEAWTLQDPERIVALFSEDGEYVERPYDPANGVYRGHDGIREYWITHIQARERNIDFRHVVDDLVWDEETSTAVVKWEARFEVRQAEGRPWKGVQFLQIARLCFAPDGRVRLLEEFWHGKSFQNASKGLRDPRARRPRAGPKRRQPELGGRTVCHAALSTTCLGPFSREKITLKARRGKTAESSTANGYPAAAKETQANEAAKPEPARNVPVVANAIGKLAPGAASRSADLVEWYRQALSSAQLVQESDVLGVPLLRPWGVFLWDELQRWLDLELAKLGAQSFSLPILGHHEPSKNAGLDSSDLGRSLLEVRPSAEPLLYKVMAKSWVKSSRDLPMIFKRWGVAVTSDNVKRPLPFMRSRELYLQEGHAAHADESEAAVFAEGVKELYLRLCEELLAVSPRVSIAPSSSNLPADVSQALGQISIGVPIPRLNADVSDSGEAQIVEVASVQQLGSGAGAAFKMRYACADAEGNSTNKDCALSSFSLTFRAIGAALSAHGDDIGFMLPPRIAPVQIVLIPMIQYEDRKRDSAGLKHVRAILRWCHDAARLLGTATVDASSAADADASAADGDAGVALSTWTSRQLRVQTDTREDVTPGKKIRYWLSRGVPLLLTAHLVRNAAEETEPLASVRLTARDMPGFDRLGSAELRAEEASKKVRQQLDLLHGRMLERHRASVA